LFAEAQKNTIGMLAGMLHSLGSQQVMVTFTGRKTVSGGHECDVRSLRCDPDPHSWASSAASRTRAARRSRVTDDACGLRGNSEEMRLLF